MSNLQRDLFRNRAGARPPVAPSSASGPPGVPPLPSGARAGGADAALGSASAPASAGEQLHAPVDWSVYFERKEDVPIAGTPRVFRVYRTGSEGPVLLLLHGGGYSAMSFALCAAQLRSYKIQVVALDQRAHGDTVTEDDRDLSVGTLVNDVIDVANALFGDKPGTKIVVAGHSMGGAIAARVASHPGMQRFIAGVIVIDVVEGTAIAALPFMRNVLEKRPPYFPSVEAGIQWSLRSNTVRNPAAAQVSVPTQRPDGKWAWRTDLYNSADYWDGWFQGLSAVFLGVRAPKLLIVAGQDRLDRDLMIAQMQGKFQHTVVASVGHVVHEDAPEETARILHEFFKRNNLV